MGKTQTKDKNAKKKSKKSGQSVTALARATIGPATVATPNSSPAATLTREASVPGGVTAQDTEDTDTSLRDYEFERGIDVGGFSTLPGVSQPRYPVKRTGSLDGVRDRARQHTADIHEVAPRYDDDAGSMTGSLKRGGSRRGSRRSRKSTQSLEGEPSQPRGLHSDSPGMGRGPSTSQERPVDVPKTNPSPRQQRLEKENQELMQKTLVQQDQLKTTQDKYQRLLGSLTMSGRVDEDTVSQLQEDHSQSLQQQEDLVMSLQQRAGVLEAKNHELQDHNSQLQHEVFSLKKMASFRSGTEDDGSQVSILKKQLQDYKDECSTLRSAVQRISAELSRYQSKYRPLRPSEMNELPGLPLKGPKPTWLVDSKYLAPLFVAYDDVLEEKNIAIREYQEELDLIKQNIDEVLKENQRLHLRIEQSDVLGPVSMTEWRQLQEQCKLVLEENQLLMEQLELQQHKANDMYKGHMTEVTRMSKQLVQLEADKARVEAQLQSLTSHVESDRFTSSSHKIETLEEHVVTVMEMKRNLEKEKKKHSNEYENLLTKVKEIAAERKALEVELEAIKAENRKLEGEVKGLHKSQRKSQRKLLIAEQALEEAQVKEKSSDRYLKSVVRAAEETLREKEILIESVHEREKEKHQSMKRLTEDHLSHNKLKEKFQMFRQQMSEQLEKAADKLKEQDTDFNKQRHELLREMNHLRNLIKEKDDLLYGVEGDKKQLEDDLETLWQSASRDNRRLQDSISESIKKMKQHETFRDVDMDLPKMPKFDEKLPLVASDDEGARVQVN